MKRTINYLLNHTYPLALKTKNFVQLIFVYVLKWKMKVQVKIGPRCGKPAGMTSSLSASVALIMFTFHLFAKFKTKARRQPLSFFTATNRSTHILYLSVDICPKSHCIKYHRKIFVISICLNFKLSIKRYLDLCAATRFLLN